MKKEAFKIIVFPHGKHEVAPGEFAYKYVFGGILLSSEEIKIPSEAIIMQESEAMELTDALLNSPKYRCKHKLGRLENGMSLLGVFTPEHHNIELVNDKTSKQTNP